MLLPRMLRVFTMAALLTSTAWSAPPEKTESALTSLTGGELIHKLQSKTERALAFYELCRRGGGEGGDKPLTEFLRSHRNPSVIVCPQGSGQAPIYLILYTANYMAENPERPDYEIKNPDDLFGPLPPPRDSAPGELVIDSFTAKGESIRLFGGNNLLTGTIADLNGDGLIERADIENYSAPKGVDSVFWISAVKENAQPLLAVLINRGTEEWTYRLKDADQTGIREVQLGPTKKKEFLPKAVFRWDAAKHTYTGPESGDHFRRLGPTDIFHQLKKLSAAFPNDPDFVKAEEPTPEEPTAVPAASPLPPMPSYQRPSLSDLTDVEIMQRMGPGRSLYDNPPESENFEARLPAKFWTMDPKKATLALVKANQSAAYREKFQLALDDRTAAPPPAAGTLSLTFSSEEAGDAHYFLRVDPKGSYLALATAAPFRTDLINLGSDSSFFDLRLCPVPYREAAQVAAVVWWLDWVRTRDMEDSFADLNDNSQSDQDVTLTLRDAHGKVLVDRQKSLLEDKFSNAWNGLYDHEIFVNFAVSLVKGALIKKLGKAWTQAEVLSEDLPEGSDLRSSKAAREKLTLLTMRFLNWFSLDQDRLAFGLVANAAEAAGSLVIPPAQPVLERILTSLPPDKNPRPTVTQIDQQIALTASNPSLYSPKKINELVMERAAAPGTSSLSFLRENVTLALRQFASADDKDALFAWSLSGEPGNLWALGRLSQIDSPRYVEALESLLKKATPPQLPEIFAEIHRVDPSRALALAEALPPGQPGPLVLPAFSVLDEAHKLTDEKTRIAQLLALVSASQSSEDRRQALDLLVPAGDPLRHPDPEIDETLLALAGKPQGDEFLRGGEGRALGLRGRTEDFDQLEKAFQTTEDPFAGQKFLSALILFAQKDSTRFQSRLQADLAHELKATNQDPNSVIWAIWTANARDLKSSLEQLATSSPNDCESVETSGGPKKPLTGRYHLARKICDIWNEKDATTRIRLLFALFLQNYYDYGEQLNRLKADLAEAGSELSPDQRQQIETFLRSMQLRASLPHPDKDRVKQLIDLIETAIKKN